MKLLEERRFKVAALIMVVLAAATFGLSFFVPIYTDEITWKVLQGSMGSDEFETVNIQPTCGTPTFRVPLLLIPFRFIDTALYQHLAEPLTIRIIGVALAVGWGFLTWLLLRRMLGSAIPAWITGTIIIAFSTLGVMPFLLVLNRPEQVLLIAMTAFLIPLIADWRAPHQRPPLFDGAVALALVAASGYVLASHPRAILALPLILLFIVHALSNRTTAVIAGAAVLLIGLIASANWGLRLQCNDPARADAFMRESILWAAQNGKLVAYLQTWWETAQTYGGAFLYLSQFQFSDSYTSQILPGAPAIIAMPLSAITILLFALMLCAGVLAFLLVIMHPGGFRQHLVSLSALAFFWAFYVMSIAARITKNTYEVSLMEPLMVLGSLGSLWVARNIMGERLGATRVRQFARLGFAALIGTSILNQVTLLTVYSRHAFDGWTDPGYARGQKYSITGFGFDALRPRILETAAMCGIDPATHPRHLVVDELTYFALEPSYQPIFMTYLDEDGWGRNITDIRALLAELNSDGMVVGCKWIPSKLRSKAIENGKFCCLPAFV